MQDIVRTGLLYDFYEKLLTDKQRKVLGFYLDDNFSLSEISEKINISRQAVHDIIKRTTIKLEDFESKLSLYENNKKNRQTYKDIKSAFDQGNSTVILNKIKLIIEG